MYSLCMMASKTLTGCNSSPERTVWFLGGVLLYLRPSQIWIWSSVITPMIHTFRSTVLWHAFRVHWKNSEGGLCIWLLAAYKTLVSVRYKGDTYFWYIFGPSVSRQVFFNTLHGLRSRPSAPFHLSLLHWRYSHFPLNISRRLSTHSSSSQEDIDIFKYSEATEYAIKIQVCPSWKFGKWCLDAALIQILLAINYSGS